MTQVGHSSATVMTEGGSRDDPGGSRPIRRDDPTVTEGGGARDFRAAHMKVDESFRLQSTARCPAQYIGLLFHAFA